MTYTISNLLKASELSRIDSRLLLCHILNWSHAKFISDANYQLTSAEYEAYLAIYNKCRHGYPLSYILGYKEFYSRKFKVTSSTLIPRPETELLVDLVLKLTKPGNRILDLGTGSGCIAISIKLENPQLRLEAVDISLDALAIARENASGLNAEIHLYQSDWFSGIAGKFSVIVSNPPYIENNDPHLANLQHEPQVALTDFADGLSCIQHIVTNAPEYLEKSGYLLFEHGYNQGDLVRNIFSNGPFTDIQTICDYAGLERVTFAKYIILESAP